MNDVGIGDYLDEKSKYITQYERPPHVFWPEERVFTAYAETDESTIRYIIKRKECGWRKNDEGVHGDVITETSAKFWLADEDPE